MGSKQHPYFLLVEVQGDLGCERIRLAENLKFSNFFFPERKRNPGLSTYRRPALWEMKSMLKTISETKKVRVREVMKRNERCVWEEKK